MTVSKLLITGAIERDNGFELGDGKYYGTASLVLLDMNNGSFTSIMMKKDGGAAYPDHDPNLQFTAAHLDGDVLWLPTDTEVYQYRLPEFQLISCISHPCFHNIHSVHLFGEQLAVTNTGLDSVVFMNKENGEIISTRNVEGKDPWHRFNAETDYRKVHSTRPHTSHPNYLMKLDDGYWVTRCTQGDVVSLDNPSRRIDISEHGNISVHDGHFWNENLIFTRVDGFLVICDANTKQVIEKCDPFARTNNRPHGWCRGLFIDEDIAYIAFSRLRKTRTISKLRYLTSGNFKYASGNEALVVKFDLKNKELLATYTIPETLLHAIYGILPYKY